jgi:hypothetical protein
MIFLHPRTMERIPVYQLAMEWSMRGYVLAIQKTKSGRWLTYLKPIRYTKPETKR